MNRTQMNLVAVLALAMVAGSAFGGVLLDDQFADGERDTQSLPGSAAWFEGGNDLAVVNNELEFENKGGSAYGHFVGYFAATPVTLAVGESLVASLDFSLDYDPADIPRGMRVSLYNSGGSKATADGSRQDAIYNAYRGYEFGVNNGDASESASLRERTGNSDILFSSGATSTLGSGTPGVDLAPNTPYNLTIMLTRTASGMDMDVTYAGTTYTTVSDTADIVDSFDTLAVFNGGDGPDDGSGDMYVDRIAIEVIPEPATMGLLGLGGLLMIRRRR